MRNKTRQQNRCVTNAVEALEARRLFSAGPADADAVGQQAMTATTVSATATRSVSLALQSSTVAANQLAVFSAKITSPTIYRYGTGLAHLYDHANQRMATSAVTSNGDATFALTGLSVGTHRFKVVYDTWDVPAPAADTSNEVELTVVAASATNPLKAGENAKLVAGQTRYPATLTIFLAWPGRPIPTGRVLVTGHEMDPVWVDVDSAGRAVATITSHTFASSAALRYAYSGDATYAASTREMRFTGITYVHQGASTAGLVASPLPGVPDGVRLTARATRLNDGLGIMSPTPPTGIIQILDGNAILGQGFLDAAGRFTLDLQTRPADMSGLRARYMGDGFYNEALSGPVVTDTKVTMTATAVRKAYEPVVVLTVDLTGVGVVRGEIAVYRDRTLITRRSVSDAARSLWLDAATAGTGTLRVVYEPDATHDAAEVEVRIVPAAQTQQQKPAGPLAAMPEGSVVVARGDFNGDASVDRVYAKAGGGLFVRLVSPDGTEYAERRLPTPAKAQWELKTAADIDGDGDDDLIWRNNQNGRLLAWFVRDGGFERSAGIEAKVTDAGWEIVGVGDYNGDGRDDLVLRNQYTHRAGALFMKGRFTTGFTTFGRSNFYSNWRLDRTEDVNADGTPDLIWRNPANGKTFAWLLRGTTVIGSRM